MTWLLVTSALLYIILLFAVALWGERRNSVGHRTSFHPWVYALSLAIYCTTWTYYGAVDNAAIGGLSFLPILLGPALLYLFGLPLLEKMVTVSKQQNITSIADFIASRYGKSHRMALVVTLIAAAAIIPYIALQLKAVGESFNLLAGTPTDGAGSWKELGVAVLMALFAIAFGTRRPDVTEYRNGMMLAIAFESLVKLVALVAVAFFAWYTLRHGVAAGWQDALTTAAANEGWSWQAVLRPEFGIQLLMAAGAIICLPRVFHVTVIDNVRISHLRTARWLFPLYLLLTAAAIGVLAIAGAARLPTIDTTTLMPLQLPLQEGQYALAMLVYIGGISAATAMVIVATLTLSTMISNDVIIPLRLTRHGQPVPQSPQFSRQLIQIRRLTIGIVLLLGWLCYHLWMARFDLVSIGLLAFSVVLQLLPAMLGGLYWRKGHAQGVYMGLLFGIGGWLVAVLLPLSQADAGLADQIITRGTVISMALNVSGYLIFSLLAVPALVDRIQAMAFVRPKSAAQAPAETHNEQARVSDLILLLETFLGRERSRELLEQWESQQPLVRQELAERDFIEFTERAIGGVLGAATARSLVHAALAGRQLNLEEVVHFFDDTTQALQTQQSIMFSSLENLAQGISVIDSDLRLVVWNRRYLELFDYPEGMVQPGRPIADLIRYNAERGECGPGEIEALVEKRLHHMRLGSAHRFIRRRSDGRVIEMEGKPLPTGGFVTSFTDITEHIETQQALEDANINLEARIRSRANEVREINRELTEEIERRREIEQELQQAKAQAEAANASKTRFLALASHDILQPLNAARLYLSAMQPESLDAHHRDLTAKVDNALDSTESLLSTLLAIAKLDQGAMQPQLKHVSLNSILEPLVEEYAVLARQRNLKFRARLRPAVVHTDPTYLRRIVQNFLSNAIKYTESGGVLIGVRMHGTKVSINVWDTGPGIPESKQQEVFEAFIRLHKGKTRGVGLGLSVAQKMAEQLNCPLELRSEPGQGTCFRVTVPVGSATQVESRPRVETSEGKHQPLHLLCVDDEPENLRALDALLQKWQCTSTHFESATAALDWARHHPAPDGLLLDYQLGGELDGLALAEALHRQWQAPVPGALVTAVREPEVKQQARELGLQFLAKPVKPAQLKALLQHLQRQKDKRSRPPSDQA